MVSFGTIASQVTDGYLGVAEYLVASGGAGVVSLFLCLESVYSYNTSTKLIFNPFLVK